MVDEETLWCISGKVALVTGASRGIGRAIAVGLASNGAKVACVATTADNCSDTVEECQGHTEGARAFGVDVSCTSEVEALVKRVQDEMGPIGILVNNAGITKDQLLLRMKESDFDRVIEVNLKGTWNFIKASSRDLMKGGGRVINISSVVGVTGNAGQSNYAASKAGVIGLTKSIAKEFAGRGVCVNAVAPGFIDTDMTSGISDSASEQLKSSIPLGRIGTPGEVAEAAMWLAGPGGAYVTGQTIVVDGGLSLGG